MALGFGVAAICIVLGYPCAYAIARSQSWLKTVYVFLVISPLVTSIVIRSYAWIVLLGQQGVVNTLLIEHGLISRPLHLMYNWTGVIVAMTHVLLPYSILSIASVLETVDSRIEDAARVLGANRWQTFWRITLPLSIEGVGTGAILVFMLAIGSFVTVWLLGGTGTSVLGLLIYQQVTVAFDTSFAAALGTFLLASSLFVLYGAARWFRRRGNQHAPA
jgi:ABC-type spermidine/putrescine transport system permease subunit I